MSRLVPYPFGALVRRMFLELDRSDAVFDLPSRRFFPGRPDSDYAVRLHGRRAATPYGPAAGPHTQLAPNIVLAWLGGARVIELKTVQQHDALELPRPCIDMQTVGFNVEWSQELKLAESLDEYVKASMLIRMLEASGRLALLPGRSDVVYDMSVGYDLAGIRSDRVAAFIRGMMDARGPIDRLRAEIPVEHARFRDLDFDPRVSGTVTLSTFHGCPPDEIERIVAHLLTAFDLDCSVKLNPMLLGKAETRRILHEVLGYREIRVPDAAFDRDTTWDQMLAFVDRLGTLAAARGRGLGVKFTNTLIVENHRTFLPASERWMYLSGPPLHVLAVELVARFRRVFGDRFPISFSAGIDRANFAEAVSLGLVPVTVCSDLLKPGGYGRSRGYLDRLGERMREAGASTIDEFVILGQGQARAALARATADAAERRRSEDALADGSPLRAAAGDRAFARWVSEARVLNGEAYRDRVFGDPRYTAPRHRKVPRKIGRRLWLFDCLSCDKCIPVCPNDANFTFVLPPADLPIVQMRPAGLGWTRIVLDTLRVEEPHQIGNYADLCNDCGNCDVFCPEDGGPYMAKPRFFSSPDTWRAAAPSDGYFLAPGGSRMLARVKGHEFDLSFADGRVRYEGPGFAVWVAEEDPEGTIVGHAVGDVDLTPFRVATWLRHAILEGRGVNFVNCLPAGDPPGSDGGTQR